MKDLMGMMKQVGQMQARVQQMQEELAGWRSTASRAAASSKSRSPVRAT